MFKKMPYLLIAIIIAIFFFDHALPLGIKSFFYAISLTIKSLIVFLLPFVIFGLLYKTTVQLAQNATKIILLVLVAVCCSNLLSTFTSQFIGMWVYQLDLSLILPLTSNDLAPSWHFEIPKIINNQTALFAGLLVGIFSWYFQPKRAIKIARNMDKLVNQLLFILTLLIPFFITGFIIKSNHDGGLSKIVHEYGLIFAVIALGQFCYITLIYFISNNFSFSKCMKSLKNMLPAAITGFSAMSSVAAMPLTLLGTEKNARNPDLARSVIPATVNIHLIGDCFAIPILAFAILKSYGVADPSFYEYALFAFYFVVAKFSVAAIPGGGIIVMLPILEQYLGFNAAMLSLITALYILFDPIITCANVLGNGGFALAMDKLGQIRIREYFRMT